MADEALKALYKTPSTPKYYVINFPSIGLNINTSGTNDKLVSGSFELIESICSDSKIVFGSCEASQVKFTVADITEDLSNLWFTITQTIGEYTVPFGIYKVETCTKQNDKRFKDIIAYDTMKQFDVDVSAWYNALDFSNLTLAQLRSSLCTYIGVTEDTTNLPLPNDSMIVQKTATATQLSGRKVLFACEQLNGCFGHINRSGELTHIILDPAYGLYPSETLYPSDDLYPISESDTSYTADAKETFTKAMYQSVKFEEYTAKEIFRLQIRQEEDDIGAIVADTTGVIVDAKTGTSVSSSKAENARAEITKIEGVSYQAVTVQGKNFFDKSKATIGKYVEKTNGNLYSDASFSTSDYISVNSNTTYTKSGSYTYAFYNSSKVFISGGQVVTFTTPSNASYIRFSLLNSSIDTVQLELGSTATTYAQFIPNSPSPLYPSPIITPSNFNLTASNGTESNSLTVTQSMGALPNGVKNEIVKVNGVTKYIQRVGSVVFDGSDSSWGLYQTGTNTLRFVSNKLKTLIKIVSVYTIGTIMSDKLKSYSQAALPDDEGVSPHNTEGIQIRINKTRLSTQNVAGFKAWLTANPVTVQYELATPIETIIPDLTLTSYKGTTSIVTTANPQVSITADFFCNTDNTYIIEGNFLVYGKGAAELEQIARNASLNIFKRPYRPFNSVNIGLPYVEVGDMVKFSTDDVVSSYVLQRTLRGIQALTDEYAAEGSEVIAQTFGQNYEIQQLKGKTAILKRNVEELSSTISDLETNTSSSITQLSNEIDLRVSKDDVIASINLSPETIKIKAPNVEFEGLVTVNNNTKILEDGTIEAANAKFSGTIDTSIINGTEVNGGTVNGAVIESSNGTNQGTKIENGLVTTSKVAVRPWNTSGFYGIGVDVTATGISASNASGVRFSATSEGDVDCKSVDCNTANISNLNGGNPVTNVNFATYLNNTSHTQSSDTIVLQTNTDYTAYFWYGALVATPAWCKANFQPKTSSDFRLKKNMRSLEELPDELYYSLKPKLFEFKCAPYALVVSNIGFLAQQVENAFELYNLSAIDYGIVEIEKVRDYTDEGIYLSDGLVHRVNYNMFIAWSVYINQKQNDRISKLEETILKLLPN